LIQIKRVPAGQYRLLPGSAVFAAKNIGRAASSDGGLYAGILVFATMGTIAAKPSIVELSMLAGFGVLGFLMRRFDFPIAPVVVGLILGPIAESQLRRALAISLGDPLVLLQSPMSATLLGIALIALLAPFVMKGLGRFRASED
jgi:putative tricarboxylic transport membrane protein